jgi:hypothetical protein
MRPGAAEFDAWILPEMAAKSHPRGVMTRRAALDN